MDGSAAQTAAAYRQLLLTVHCRLQATSAAPVTPLSMCRTYRMPSLCCTALNKRSTHSYMYASTHTRANIHTRAHAFLAGSYGCGCGSWHDINLQ